MFLSMTGQSDSEGSMPIEAASPDDKSHASDFQDADTTDTSIFTSDNSVFEVMPIGLGGSQHTYRNGRRYHRFRNGTYMLPNDMTEQNRDELKHVLMLELTGGKLFLAPIDQHPQRIIDLGTGTGSWAVDVADDYAGAEVIGTDLSSIQPYWVPSNLKFVIDDIEDSWVHGNNFDLVHLRHVCQTLKDVPYMCSQSLEHLKPGGWIELQEYGGMAKCDDGSMGPDSYMATFMNKCAEAMAMTGHDWQIGQKLGEILQQTGFVNVKCKRVKTPLGRWAKDLELRRIGEYNKLICTDLLGAMGALPLKRVMEDAEIEDLVANASEEMVRAKKHMYIEYFFWWAQKPTS